MTLDNNPYVAIISHSATVLSDDICMQITLS